MVDGIDAESILQSERFYDVGKGYYWSNYNIISAATSLYSSTGGYSFLGDLANRVATSSGISSATFDNLKGDANTCWYQVSSNVLQYWQSYYGVFYKGDRELVYGYNYDKQYADELAGTQSLKLGMYFYDNWANEGGNIIEAAKWYLSGVDDFDTLNTTGNGGFFSGYYDEGESVYSRVSTHYSDNRDFRRDLYSLFGMKKGVGDSYSQAEVGKILYLGVYGYSDCNRLGHALTCYGFECDDEGYVTSLKVTNSDDSQYGMFTLYLRRENATLWLYEDAACTKLWRYSNANWYLSEMFSINTSEQLKHMYSVYADASTPLVWTGSASAWKNGDASSHGDALPDASSGWDVQVDADYFHAFGDAARRVRFDDYATNRDVQVRGTVSTPEMTVQSSSPYTFTGTSAAKIQATLLEQSGTAGVSFSQVALSGNRADIKLAPVILKSGSSLDYRVGRIDNGGCLTLAGGNAAFDSLILGPTGSLVVSSSGKLVADSLSAEQGALFEFGKSAVLTFDGSISSDSRIELAYTGTAQQGATLTLITFAESMTDWASVFSTTYGTLSYRADTLYLTYTPHAQLHWGNTSSTWTASLWKNAAQNTTDAEVFFEGASGGSVTVSGRVNPYSVDITDGDYTFAAGDVNARIEVTRNLTLSGDSSLVLKVPVEATGVSLLGNSSLTLNKSLGSITLSNLDAHAGTSLVIDSDLTAVIRNVSSLGNLTVGTGASLTLAQNGILEMNGTVQSSGNITLCNGAGQKSSTYVLTTGTENITGSVILQDGVTLRVATGDLTSGSYVLPTGSVLELASSGNFSAAVQGNGGTIRVLPATEWIFEVDSANKPTFSSGTCLDVQGKATINPVASAAILKKAEVSGELSVSAYVGEVSMDELVLTGGKVDILCRHNYKKSAADFIINNLDVTDAGGLLLTRLSAYNYTERMGTTIKSLTGTGDLTISGTHYYAPVFYRLLDVGSADYSGNITLLHDSMSWISGETLQQGTVLELGALTMSGSIFIKNLRPCVSESANALFFTALGLTEDATIGGLASTPNPATRAILFSGQVRDDAVSLAAGLNFNTMVNAAAHTLTIDATKDYDYHGIVEKSLSLVKKGTGTQTFHGEMGAFNGNVMVQGGTLRFVDSLAAARTSISTSSLVCDADYNAGSMLTMNNGRLSAASLQSKAASFTGTSNSIDASSISGTNWAFNLTVDNLDKPVLTLLTDASGTLSLSGLSVHYDADEMYAASFKVLQYDSSFTGASNLTSLLTGSYVESSTVNGETVYTLMYKVSDGAMVLPRDTPATLTWRSSSGTWANAAGHEENVWSASVSNRNFYAGDTVLFNSAATVSLAGTLKPAEVKVNSTENIHFTGTGSIAGSSRLTKSGAGRLTISTANTYTGGTSITGGIVQTNHSKALGVGQVSLQNATLHMSDQALQNNISTSGASSITNADRYTGKLSVQGGSLSGNIGLAQNASIKGGKITAKLSGSGAVLLSGSVTMSGANSFTGGAMLDSAQVVTTHASALGLGAITCAGNSSISAAAGSSLSLGSSISNSGTLSLSGSFVLNGFKMNSLSDSRVDVSGHAGSSGFLSSGGYYVQMVNGGTVKDTGASISHNSNSLVLNSNGRALYAGEVDYSSYLVSAGASVGVSEIKAAARDGGASACGIVLNGGSLTLDSNVAGSLTLNSGSLILNGDKEISVSDGVTIQSPLTVTLGSGFALAGTYSLLSCSDGFNISGSIADYLKIANPEERTGYSFYIAGDTLKLDVEKIELVLSWCGGKQAVWGTGQNTLWKSEDGLMRFSNGDRVEFCEQGNVQLSGEVLPSSIVVDCDKAVTFKTNPASGGCISGHGTLHKFGAGVLTISTDNDDWEGSIFVQCGTLKAGHDDAFGCGTIKVSNAATLDFGSKKVDSQVEVVGSACLKNGKNFKGALTLHGDLLKGSVVNVSPWSLAEWYSGEVNGTISGSGEVLVLGDVSLGLSGKVSTEYLTLENGSRLSVSSKGMAMSAKNSLLTMEHAEIISAGKLSTNELQMTGGEISIDTAKAMSLDIKGKTTSSLVDNGRISVAGKMSVAGNLELAGAASIRLYDPSGKNKAMPLAVKGSLTLGSGSTLTLSGALSAKDMVLDGGTINLTSNKPLTIKVGNRLDINGPVDLNLGFTVADKDVNKKSFKILTFKSSNLGGEEELYDLLGLSDSYCSLSFDKKKTSVMLTVTDKEAWDAYIADEETEAPTATTALVNPALPDYSGVADALVQANWGLVESSRAFVNAIGNRSMAVQLGSGEHAVWASAIAGASRRSSSGTHGGADTNITGGAIGMETQLGENSLLGMALGNSWTRVSAHNYGTIKQDTTHLGVYGQTNWNKLSADWSAAYGRSESKFNGSDWSQRAIQLDGRLSYNHALSETVLLRGFGGVQYYASDSARVDGIDTGEVQNLRGEIGVGIVRSTYKSSVYAELALHQDLVRDNPEVRSPFGQRYHGTNPGRTGINLTIGGSYALSDQWSVNASYTAEVVENANAHSVNVGATYKF